MTDLEGNITVGWIYRPPPFTDELLSSWLSRIAFSHRDSLISFCKHEWPSNHFHYHDIDVLAPKKLISTLVHKTAASRQEAAGSCLNTWDGLLYPQAMLGGKARFIMAAGAGAHICRSAGMQWCPECLLTDSIPYWRKVWRLSFITCCTVHSIRLADRCQDCGERAIPRRRADTRCWSCLADLRLHQRQKAHDEVIKFQLRLENQLSTPVADGLEPLFKELNQYEGFRALWTCFRLLAVSRISNRLCEHIDSVNNWNMSPREASRQSNWRTEALGVNARHEAIRRLSYFQDNWPSNFIATCNAIRMNWSDFVRGSEYSGFPVRLQSMVESEFRRYG